MATRILHIADAKDLHRRYYPLELPISYVALSEGHVIQSGRGATVEISGSYVRTKPLGLLNPGATDVVMSIAWPARLPDGTNLQLVIHTKPVGESPVAAAFRILKHEFRTVSKDANGLGLRAELPGGSGRTSHKLMQPSIPVRSLAAAPGMRLDVRDDPFSSCERRNEKSFCSTN